MKLFSHKKLTIGILSTLLILTLASNLTIADPEPTDESTRSTHTVLGEYGTATWCGYCRYAHAALKNIYAGGQQDFYYVTFVNDMNPYCAPRMND